MDAYKTVPRVSENYNAVNQTFYINGIVIFTYDNTQEYRIGYGSNDSYTIRIAMYKEGTGGRYPMNFVIYSPVSIENIDIRVISPYMSTIETITSINTRNMYGSGYYTEFQFTRDYITYALNPYSTLEECLSVMEYESPSEDSGVVVVANASPLDIPVSSDGVIVNAIARLLDSNDQGGTSIPGGGSGTFDETTDVIPIPTLPNISAANSGLVTLFKPTLSELQSLGSYLWTNITDFIENLQKMFSNPMDYFVAFHIVPCIPGVGTARTIKLGLWNTGISMSPVNSQWYEHNCGTISVPEFWGSALDYSPNTKVSLFLPFIGSVTLNTDEIMNQRINLTYRIDLLSGQCVAMVTATSPVDAIGSVVYQYTGECSVSIPLTGADWSRIYSAGIGAVGTAISGGLGAAATHATLGAAASNAANAGRALSARAQTANGILAANISSTVNNTIGSVMAGKQGIPHSGSITGSAGMLGVKTPYLTIEYPAQSIAENYKHFVGYPSNMYSKLNILSGYTECEKVIPDNSYLSMNDTEMGMLLESLKNGVYLNFSNMTGKRKGIVLYSYGGLPNTLGKGATYVESLTGVFREPTDISHPVFTIERSSPIGFNYVYIEDFDRFYFVNEVTAEQRNLVTVTCTIDPLETAGTAIGNFSAIIRRQENSFNLYLDDGIFKAYQNTKHKHIAFPNPFTEYAYILALAGNSDSGS